MIDPTTGQTLLVWTVRFAVACYIARLLVARCRVVGQVPKQSELVWWAIGCLAYLAHVVLAFTFTHDWSHRHAWEHTAIETERLTGIRRGEGLWVNYVFTLTWCFDVIRLAFARSQMRATKRGVDFTVHAFFAFIIFNATVVFGPALYRILAIPIFFALILSGRMKQNP
ncbi:MAG: hypothetical protein HKN47_13780 [Pirellulaceae bacterium]|nr:hypothetical protein [Pirellulaceae bacterium]